MITPKVVSKGVAKVCLRKWAKVHTEKKIDNVLHEAAKEDVTAKLQRIQEMLGELEEEVLKQFGVVGFQVQEGQSMDAREQRMILVEQINVLDNHIHNLFDNL